ASPLKKDLVQPIVYDEYGRETKKYLPYADSGTSYGAYRSTALSSQAGFYNSPPAGVVQIPSSGGITPSFAETRFEPSPVSRVEEQGARGAAWQLAAVHTVKTECKTNSSSGSYAVRLYQAGAAASPEEHNRILSSPGSYGAGELYLP